MKCRFCNQPAGWLSFRHEACEETQRRGILALAAIAEKYVASGVPADFRAQYALLAASTFNSAVDTSPIETGARSALSTYIRTGATDPAVELRLVTNTSQLLSEERRPKDLLKRMVFASIVRDLGGGPTSDFLSRETPYPDTKKGEFLIWTFQGVRYLEERVHRHVEGRSAGVSQRLGHGLTIRVGKSSGRVVERASLDELDVGTLAITNHRLHFSGNHKAFKLNYAKLALIEPHADALKVIRDAVTAKPQVFIVDDGWFLNEVFQVLT